MTSLGRSNYVREGLGAAGLCVLLVATSTRADGGDTTIRAFLGDGTFVVMTRYPLHGSSGVMTRTLVPAGAAVLQSTVAMGAAPVEPEGSTPAQAAPVRAIGAGGALCEAGCGTPPRAPEAPMTYEVTVPPGGPQSVAERIRVALDATTRGHTAVRLSAASVTLSLRFEVMASTVEAAWVSPRRDVLVLELRDPGDCCPGSATAAWVSVDLQRLVGTGTATATGQQTAEGAATRRIQQWRGGLPSGWVVDIRRVGGLVVAQASIPSAPMGTGAPSCTDDEGSWTKTHRTLVASDQSEAEVPGVVVGAPVDIDKDGRDDLIVAYEHVCQSPGGHSDPGQRPSGDFAVVFDRPGGIVWKQHVALGAQAPAALWNVSVQRQGRGVVIRAAGMKPGVQPVPTGEMYDFKWQGGEIVLVRRFPGSG